MEINPPTASLIKRYAALFYELLLLLALLFVADYLFISFTHNAHSPRIRTALQIYLLGITGMYFIWMWMRGQSLAMKTWHIRLVTVDNKPLSFPRAALRFVLAVCLIGISQLWALVDRDHQFLHDRLSGTRLIQSEKR
uniref:RDD n=1 Tax=mine drainage metagenome TaxID=410659 RepID=E6QPX8_9ZZZZ